MTLAGFRRSSGGKHKRCHIRVPLPSNLGVVIQDTELDLYAAIDLAADRTQRGDRMKYNRHLATLPGDAASG